jgi:hypothetical protein
MSVLYRAFVTKFSLYGKQGNFSLGGMKVMVEPYNVYLEKNSQEKSKTKLNHILKGH